MPPTITWTTGQPSHPPGRQVEDAVLASLRHFIDPKNVRDKVVSVFLEQDQLGRNVQGVGYSKDNAPLVRFNYSLVQPWTCP